MKPIGEGVRKPFSYPSNPGFEENQYLSKIKGRVWKIGMKSN
jgi:hypothetical protein